MSPARWTPTPLAEREAEESAREARRAEARVWLALAAVATACPLGLAITVTGTLGWLVTVALVAGAVALLDRANTVRREAQGTAWSRDAAMVDDLGAREAWLVELIVHAGDALIGTDRGMLWIEDGRLYFAGARTSFGLTPEQAEPCVEQKAVPSLRHGLRLPLRVLTFAGRAAISFTLVRGARRQAAAETSEVAYALDRWMRESAAAGGQPPPVVPGPGAPTLFSLAQSALGATLFWAVVAGGLVSVWPLGLLGLFLGLRWSAVRDPALRWRALHGRRRLERAQWKA